jgi:hypothetical protein
MGRSFLAESQGRFRPPYEPAGAVMQSAIASAGEPFGHPIMTGINRLVFMFNSAAVANRLVSMGLPWRSHFVNA